MDRFLNAGFLLRWAAKRSGTTDPRGLESMTLSVMQGETGTHAVELDRLVHWLKTEAKPDVVHLSNALLIGIGTAIKKRLGIPVFCTLQDEDSWIDSMREPFASRAWNVVRESAEILDACIAVSRYYARKVMERAGVPESAIAVVPLGIPVDRYLPAEPSLDPPVIGFLSRMSPALGLDILVEAFSLLKKDPGLERCRLRISGGLSTEDRPFVRKLRARVRAVVPDLYREDVRAFFDSLTLLSVPAPEGEAFALFLLESMASGIPVVQPDRGAYPELLAQTEGGVVYGENTPRGLADALKLLLGDPEKLREAGQRGCEAVRGRFTIGVMADRLTALYEKARPV
jgi:glycosyltransferase involved in cell wall biosynthesis